MTSLLENPASSMTLILDFLRQNENGTTSHFEDICKTHPQVSENTLLIFSKHRRYFYYHDHQRHVASLHLHAGNLIYAYISPLDTLVIYRTSEDEPRESNAARRPAITREIFYSTVWKTKVLRKRVRHAKQLVERNKVNLELIKQFAKDIKQTLVGLDNESFW